jgi:sigma-54 dependent transcriptional regulator, acetoin dehydrogenase operon transcriptional activator AcoR
MQDFLNKLCNIIFISLNEKRMEVKVTSLMNQFRDVINSIYEGIIAINTNGSITNINKAAEKMLGLELGNKKGHHIKNLFPDFNVEDVINMSYSSGSDQYFGKEISYNGSGNRKINLFYNITLMYEDKSVSGAVLSFRRKEEVEEMANRIVKENKKTTFPVLSVRVTS